MRKAAILFLFLILISLFLAQMYRVLVLRFETGDAYPPYSSLRADPQGTKALYESLENMPGLQVERQTRDFMTLRADEDTVIVMAGATISPDPISVIEAIEGLVQNGGRLIITFSPFVAQSMAFWASEHVPPLEEEGPLKPED
ncbi:MAG: DUF4350 domain-containing protein, partial [Candidatus Hydrogenedentes bacterium]|nr:DUF4350 domain-containing protein [Candidatus Hydrogenedentota bacterium]